MYPEQCGVISAHHTRINGKIPDFTIAREGGVTECVEFTMATVLIYCSLVRLIGKTKYDNMIIYDLGRGTPVTKSHFSIDYVSYLRSFVTFIPYL